MLRARLVPLAVLLIVAGGGTTYLAATMLASSFSSAPSARSTRAATTPAATRPPPVTVAPSPSPTRARHRRPAPAPAPKSTSTSRATRSPRPAAASSRGTGRLGYGATREGVATFYPADGGGNCMFPAGGSLMVGAMNQADYDGSSACGAYLSVRGPSGRSITIRIVDRCPECPVGAIDLSREAFTKLAPASAGRIPISWHLVSPALRGPVSYVYKSGSSRYWCAVQVRNHRNPVASLQVRSGSSWRTLPRADYNHFVSQSGAGCGGMIRVTDIYGNRLIDGGIGVRPDAVQPGHAQFPAH